jgi:hypothetical protein
VRFAANAVESVTTRLLSLAGIAILKTTVGTKKRLPSGLAETVHFPKRLETNV